MKKVNIILVIISVIIIMLGIIIGTGIPNEILNEANGIDSGIGEKYSGIIEIFGFFGAKIIGTVIIVFSVVTDIVMWLFYGLVLLCTKIIKKIKNNK